MMSTLPQAASLRPGFKDPVFDSQAVFRSVMQAMSRPGLPVRLATELAPPAPLTRATAAVALTLCDFETPIWLDQPMAIDAAMRYLRFHCGCPLVDVVDAASFAIVASPKRMPSLAQFRQGNDAYPDRSATLVLQVEGLDRGPAFRLSGPGIRETARLSVRGLPSWFAAAWKLNNAQYPVGVDAILTCADTIVGLPRSTRLED